MTFGEKLREARKLKEMTQRQLANEIGAKHNSVSDWENNKNKPDPDTIELICGILDITPNYLLNLHGDDFSPTENVLIKKYRTLDPIGKDTVDIILDIQYRRCTNEDEDELDIKVPHPYDGPDSDKIAEVINQDTIETLERNINRAKEIERLESLNTSIEERPAK